MVILLEKVVGLVRMVLIFLVGFFIKNFCTINSLGLSLNFWISSCVFVFFCVLLINFLLMCFIIWIDLVGMIRIFGKILFGNI